MVTRTRSRIDVESRSQRFSRHRRRCVSVVGLASCGGRGTDSSPVRLSTWLVASGTDLWPGSTGNEIPSGRAWRTVPRITIRKPCGLHGEECVRRSGRRAARADAERGSRPPRARDSCGGHQAGWGTKLDSRRGGWQRHPAVQASESTPWAWSPSLRSRGVRWRIATSPWSTSWSSSRREIPDRSSPHQFGVPHGHQKAT